MVKELYYKNQTGTLEVHQKYMAMINSKGPYKPNTLEHLKHRGTIGDIMSHNHVLCPDGTVKYNLSSEEADNLCFKFNLAYFKGKEDAEVELEKIKKG